MIIANKILLDDFVQSHVQALKQVNRWLQKVNNATWTSHADLKCAFPSADYVKNGRYVFNIGGNKFGSSDKSCDFVIMQIEKS